MKPVKSANDWWRECAAEDGLRWLDRFAEHGTADWATIAKNGLVEFKRAKQLTDMPTGPELSLLEIGCGGGRMTWALAEAFGQVVAVDVSEAYIKLAERHCAKPNVSFRTILGNDLDALRDRLYDVVFSFEVFHHLDRRVLERYISDIHGLLRPGGSFVLQLNTKPMRLVTRISIWFRYVLHLAGKKHWRGWPTSPHFARQPYSAETIRGILTETGFQVQKMMQPGQSETWFVATTPIRSPSPQSSSVADNSSIKHAS
jgi:2-polyprenyl-3-methyl-5-hydroxy-6-metoxy-1,4-benzoquinol methylase